MPGEPLFYFQQCTLARGHHAVLAQLDWAVKRGEHWLITGANGAGKSTLAEAISGRHRIMSGERRWPGLAEAPAKAIRLISFTDTGPLFHNANAVHYYQQRFNAFDADGHLTVREYLLANGHTETSARAALSLLKAADLLHLERIKLSSGQTRKLLLAKCLAGRPGVLVVDNPYLGLDAGSRVRLNRLLDELVSATGVTLLLAVPRVTTLPACLTHHLHLSGGSGEVVELEKVNMEKSILAPAGPATPLSFPPATPGAPAAAVIRLEEVTIAYADKVVLNRLSWQVHPGEKWLVSGSNGSGKSTLLSLLYADHPQAYANRIFLFGKRRGRGESIWDIKRRIGFTSPELHAFFDGNLLGREVILSGLNDTFLPPQHPTEQQLSLLADLLNFAGIRALADRRFRECSTGEQRLLLLLRALIKAPPVLLLDEPFQGLDAHRIKRCRELLATVLTPDRTLIFISHFREEVPEGVDKELPLAAW